MLETMDLPAFKMQHLHAAPTWLRQRLLYVTRAGSHAYGTAVETSDADFRGICAPPLPQSLSPFSSRFEQFATAEPDIVIYGLDKFFRLAAAGNPNVLELLFVDPGHVVYSHPAIDPLIESRSLFLSRKVAATFTGYAVSQLHKMHQDRPESAISQRTPVRAGLERDHGFDTKNAMHLVRLLRSGLELIETGHLHVTRQDGDELLSIRRGEVPLDVIKAEADDLLSKIDDRVDSSPLPAQVDVVRLEELFFTTMGLTSAQDFDGPVQFPRMHP